MAPPRHRTWRTLLVGIVAIGALAAAALWVLVFARVDALHGDRYHLTLLAGGAGQVIQGTEVWLAGQQVGRVADVRLRPVSTDPAHRLAIDLELLREYQPQIRANSHAALRHAGSPIGASVIMLTVGTARAPMLADGDTLLASPKTSRQQLVDELEDASQQVPHLVANVHAILHAAHRTVDQRAGIPSPRSTTAGLGALARRVTRRIASFDRRTTSHAASGTPRPTAAPPAGMRTTAEHLASDYRAAATAAAAAHGTIDRLQHDTALGVTLRDLGRRLSSVGSLLGTSRGSAGRFVHDSALAQQLHRNR
ncbi:MAG TPA: MlaD family protein [Gemmatimonadaceae bacterium]